MLGPRRIVFGHPELASLTTYPILLRRGTRLEWESANPFLLANEVGIDTTEDAVKIGDGVHQWTDLEYATGGQAMHLLVWAR